MMSVIFGDYDRAGLDAQYNLRARVPEHPAYAARWSAASEAVRRDRPARLDLAYGPSPAETLDLFAPAVFAPAGPVPAAGAPLLIFIHGGYWHSRDKHDFSFVAPAYLDRGIAVALVNYALAPAVAMAEIVRQNRAAIAFLHARAGELGLDRDRLFVSGHSAGGHLTALMMATDWAAEGLPEAPLRGGCALSGIYDLEPIRLCYLNEMVRLDAAAVRELSPLRRLPARSAPLLLAVGDRETEEFRRQQAEFAAARQARRLPGRAFELPGDDHFSAVDRLAESGSLLWRAVVEQISASAADAARP